MTNHESAEGTEKIHLVSTRAEFDLAMMVCGEAFLSEETVIKLFGREALPENGARGRITTEGADEPT